jgi:formylglycine-generating enzyme required for sulfatase activity
MPYSVRQFCTALLATATLISWRSFAFGDELPAGVSTLTGRVEQVYLNEKQVATNHLDHQFAIEVALSKGPENAGKPLPNRIFIKTWQALKRPKDWKGPRGQSVIPAPGDIVEFQALERAGVWELSEPNGVRIIAAATARSVATGLELKLIQPGEFQMGSPDGETHRRADERLHRVVITTPFYLGTYEVTQSEYRQVMQGRPSAFAISGSSKEKVPRLITERFPVDSVSWFDAVEFCNRLSQKDGFEPYYRLDNVEKQGDSIEKADVAVRGGAGYRLPTEAEWEYACRAGTRTPYYYGKESSLNTANVQAPMIAGGYGAQNPKWNVLGRTAKVGSYPPNDWGLYDMHGNVEEWCADWYDQDTYSHAPPEDPRGPNQGLYKVVRGGSWILNDAHCRAACRIFHMPREAKFYGGFRVARTPQL